MIPTMRFSVLTLNLHTWQESDQLEKFDRIARFVSQENLTCLCLQECGQRSSSPFVVDSDSQRSDNAAYLIQDRLEVYGLKYSMIWDFSHNSFGSYEEGSAILTQLPILGHCSRYVSEGDDPRSVQTRNVIMARLAAAPNSVIDLYSTHLSPPVAGLESQIAELLAFVDETPEMLERMKPPPPKRRGPPRKRVPAEDVPVSTRMVCVAGDMNEEPGGLVKAFAANGLLEASAGARESGSVAGTFEDGRWIDYVFIRPALRPQRARVVFAGSDAPPVSDHYGIVVEFEV